MLSPSVRITAALACACTLAACGSDGPTGPAGFTTAAHAAFPTLTNAGGHVLATTRVVAIVPANHDRTDSLFLFANAIPTSTWAREVGQPYGVTIQSARTVAGPAITADTLVLAQLQSYVAVAISSSPDLAPDGQTVYVVFLPRGVLPAGGPACDYHAPYDSGGNAIAIIAYCTGTESLASLTVAASHEIIESASDPALTAWYIAPNRYKPWLDTPWGFDDGISSIGEENADLCLGTHYTEGGFTYTRVYSNAAAAHGGDPCVPSLDVPYYNVSSPSSWYTATNGVAHITLTGWSTAQIEDWLVGAYVDAAQPSAPTVTFDGGSTILAGGKSYPAVNNGRTITLTVTFPAGAPEYDFAVIHVWSERLNAALSGPRAGEDVDHGWAVGVYIP